MTMTCDRSHLFPYAMSIFLKNALSEAREIENELRSQSQVYSRSTLGDGASGAELDRDRWDPYDAH
jgi:hypothetical protein